MDSATPEQVILGCVRNQTEQSMRRKPGSNVPLGPLLPSVRALWSCPDFPQRLPMIKQ